MALFELIEHRQQARITQEIFTGVAYVRVLRCPKGEADGYLAAGGALDKGTFLPVAYGGPADSLVPTSPRGWVGDPILQEVKRAQQPMEHVPRTNQEVRGSFDELEATYVSVDMLTNGTAYSETSRPREREIGEHVASRVYRHLAEHHFIIHTVGVSLPSKLQASFTRPLSDGPTVGDYLDGVDTSSCRPICQQVIADTMTHSGRVFVKSNWAGVMPMGPEAKGYMEVFRTYPSQDKYEIEVLGVCRLSDLTGDPNAPVTGMGAPKLGDFLDGISTPKNLPVCYNIDVDTTRHSGRVFVRSFWRGTFTGGL